MTLERPGKMKENNMNKIFDFLNDLVCYTAVIFAMFIVINLIL